MQGTQFIRVATALLILAPGLGCGDDATGPEDLEFPALSSELRSMFCVRGNLTVGDTRSGNLTDDDCEEDGDFFEVYVVKVRSSGTVTFEVSSNFDSELFLGRIDWYSNDDVDVTDLDEDSDSGPGLNARLSYPLQPGVNYVVAISGWGGDTGPYTLSVR